MADVLKIDNLFARRSVRQYRDEPLREDEIELLLKAGAAAPSAGNRRPWHFIVVTDPAMRQALADIHPHAQMARQAPVCIVACGQPDLSYPGTTEFWIQDLAAATENILLAAVGLGLGAVWCGVYPLQERVRAVRRVLGIPDEVAPFAYIVVGHPAEQKEPRTQLDPARVHRDRW